MRRAARPGGALLCALLLGAGCSPPPVTPFSTDRARAHVRMLAGTIGSRPAGSEANDRARDYLVNELRALGFEVRVQAADARRPEAGITVRVHNVIAVKTGARPDAIALVSHYDSSPFAPGGADDGLGVAVSVEAARVLAAAPMQHTLIVLLTDGEELGLMGAAAFTSDPSAGRINAYLNVEAVGSGGPSLLFETGPGNAWIVKAWARSAPEPRGGSYALEIYRRIPNDTDFSILKRLNVPGLNFAAAGDGYPYHTARDTAERLSSGTIEQTGHTVVRVVEALDRVDLTRRTLDQATYFDLLGRTAFSFGPLASAWIAGLALVIGFLAWLKSVRAAIAAAGGARLLLTALWSILGSAFVLAGMIAAAWLLREAREVYHPWYARPDRLFVLTALIGILAGWSAARVGGIFPRRLRGIRHPVLAWAIALPVWVLLAGLATYFTPAAAYLFALPLLVASILLLLVPLSAGWPVRLVSLVSFAFNLALWGWPLLQLLRFLVAHFGRLPVVTPAWVYAAVMFVAASVTIPPALALLTGRPLRRPALATAVLLALVVAAAGYAYVAPAYTHDQPLRRAVRFVQDSGTPSGYWQVGSIEPGLDVHPTGMTWSPLDGPPALSVPSPRLPHPFVFSTQVHSVVDLPAQVTMRTGRVGGAVELTLSVFPRERPLAAQFVMPPGVVPARPNLPGIPRMGRWSAIFAAVPPEGVAFHAFLREEDEPQLARIRVVLRSRRLPGGTGWQGLPSWLPQDRAVWSSEARYIVQPLPEVAPPQ